MILALKGSCIQPIDPTDSTDAQEQTLNMALTAGLTSNASIDLNQNITRGEFFTFIKKAQLYKTENPDAVDENLPGCTSLQTVNLDEIAVQIPTKMTEDTTNTDDSEKTFSDPDTGLTVTLGRYDLEGKTTLKSYIDLYKTRLAQENNYQLIRQYDTR